MKRKCNQTIASKIRPNSGRRYGMNAVNHLDSVVDFMLLIKWCGNISQPKPGYFRQVVCQKNVLRRYPVRTLKECLS